MGRRRVSFYGDTAEEANNKKFQALADQAKGVLFSDPARLTVGEHLQSWLTDTARYQVSEGTFERYERTCRNHLVPFFGRLRLRELTAAHVRAFKARKIDARPLRPCDDPQEVRPRPRGYARGRSPGDGRPLLGHGFPNTDPRFS
jgi:Phage integrase, N-terminal SAM-like domain